MESEQWVGWFGMSSVGHRAGFVFWRVRMWGLHGGLD